MRQDHKMEEIILAIVLVLIYYFFFSKRENAEKNTMQGKSENMSEEKKTSKANTTVFDDLPFKDMGPNLTKFCEDMKARKFFDINSKEYKPISIALDLAVLCSNSHVR